MFFLLCALSGVALGASAAPAADQYAAVKVHTLSTWFVSPAAAVSQPALAYTHTAARSLAGWLLAGSFSRSLMLHTGRMQSVYLPWCSCSSAPSRYFFPRDVFLSLGASWRIQLDLHHPSVNQTRPPAAARPPCERAPSLPIFALLISRSAINSRRCPRRRLTAKYRFPQSNKSSILFGHPTQPAKYLVFLWPVM